MAPTPADVIDVNDRSTSVSSAAIGGEHRQVFIGETAGLRGCCKSEVGVLPRHTLHTAADLLVYIGSTSFHIGRVSGGRQRNGAGSIC